MDPITLTVVVLALGLAVVTVLVLRSRGAHRLPPPESPPPKAGQQQAVEERASASPPPRASAVPLAMHEGLTRTRAALRDRLARFFETKSVDPAILDDIETTLIGADLGAATVAKMIDSLRERLRRDDLRDGPAVWAALREQALEILSQSDGLPAQPAPAAAKAGPKVILVVGVNGAGKTTTIGKLASRLQQQGKSVLLAAGDTFRAAAVLQLEVWGRRVGCPVVKGKEKADPASVIFDAVNQAREQGVDVVIADTAGRLHTKTPLMDELNKVYRTAKKALGDQDPAEVILVLDATNGQNAIQQAALFKATLPITGIALTKLDGTAKGGVVLGIVDEHQLPVRYIGVGEKVEDLRDFDAAEFVDAVFAGPRDAPAAA